MGVSPKRTTGWIKSAIDELDRHVHWSPRYTYRSPSFGGFDIYSVRVRPEKLTFSFEEK
jgi:hypothetical protein